MTNVFPTDGKLELTQKVPVRIIQVSVSDFVKFRMTSLELRKVANTSWPEFVIHDSLVHEYYFECIWIPLKTPDMIDFRR